eukprot:m.197448 g.197448  ORF g.197448 m.197448 type:complete len:55 (+) comp17664_c3_seq3:332-496(+)
MNPQTLETHRQIQMAAATASMGATAALSARGLAAAIMLERSWRASLAVLGEAAR